MKPKAQETTNNQTKNKNVKMVETAQQITITTPKPMTTNMAVPHTTLMPPPMNRVMPPPPPQTNQQDLFALLQKI